MDLLRPKFIELDGCVLVAEAVPERGFDLSEHHDRTAAEALLNHVHILDRFKHRAARKKEPFFDRRHPDFVAGCELGKAVAHSWASQLQSQFPHKQFRVYFTQEQEPIVRFHTVHAGEPVWLDEDQWVDARDAGELLVITVLSCEPNEAA